LTPDDDRSFTEIEFDSAKEKGVPCLIFAAPEEFAVPANLIESDDLRARLKAFRARALTRPVGVFDGDKKDLVILVLEAFHNLRAELVSTQQITSEKSRKTGLLFPYVTAAYGYDTGIAISNTGADPFGTQGEAGVCTFNYYGGADAGQGEPPPPQVSAVVSPGSVLLYTLSQGAVDRLLDNRGSNFVGYIVVECNFPFAHGFASLTARGAGPKTPGISCGYLATVINSGRDGE
jgi:hypothetical protein